MHNPNAPPTPYQLEKPQPTMANQPTFRVKRSLKRVKSKSTNIKEWGEALNVFLVHYLVMWLYVIIMLLSDVSSGSFLSLANDLIFNIDLGLYEYFFLYISMDYNVFIGIAISWNVALLFSGIAYGPRANKVFFKAILSTFYLALFLFGGALISIYLLISITIGLKLIIFWFALLVLILVFFLVYAVITSIPSFLIVSIFFAKKNVGPISPYKEMIPKYLAIPAFEAGRIKINLAKDPSLFCPYRLKERPGCSFLGYEVTDAYPLICDQPETWTRCFVFKYITNKRKAEEGGSKFE